MVSLTRNLPLARARSALLSRFISRRNFRNAREISHVKRAQFRCTNHSSFARVLIIKCYYVAGGKQESFNKFFSALVAYICLLINDQKITKLCASFALEIFNSRNKRTRTESSKQRHNARRDLVISLRLIKIPRERLTLHTRASHSGDHHGASNGAGRSVSLSSDADSESRSYILPAVTRIEFS